MSFKFKALLPVLASCLFVACTKSDNNSGGTPADINRAFKTSGISCNSGFNAVPTDTIDSVVKSSSDKETRTVTLKSSLKYGYDQSAYNLSGNCFSRKVNGCETNDQLIYNHGGDAKKLGLTGHFIVLEKGATAKFDDINIENLNILNLKTTDGTVVSRDTIFGNPSTDRKMALGESSIYKEYDTGTVVLALVDDTWSNDNYQLFKMRIEKVSPGEEVAFSYQKIAEAPKADLKNYYCSKQTEIKNQSAAKSEGEAVVYGRGYAGYEASTFGFDFGVNGFDGRFVRSNRVMSFGDGQKCSGSQTEMCVTPYVGWVVSYWGGVIDLGEKDLKQVDRTTWANLQSIDPKSASMALKANRTYAISQLNDSDYTFGAIRINEIDPQGRWIKFSWKRVAIEKPFRFVNYTQLGIPVNEVYGQVSLGNKWNVDNQLDVSSGKRIDEQSPRTEYVYFDATGGNFAIDNRYYPTNSGIAEVTETYNAIEGVPEGAADTLVNKFQRNTPIKAGSVYVISSETLWYKVSIAVQVVDYVPNKSVTLKYKRLYNAQTFPGQWDNHD